MARRIPGSYGKRSRSERTIQPILGLACEGETEDKYANYAARGHEIRVRSKVFRGRHGEQLIDEALSHATRLEQHNPDALVIPAVLCDLEGSSMQLIKEAGNAYRYAERNGVKFWVSIPVIERWFTLHYKHISLGRGVRAINNELGRQLQANRMTVYTKPGNASFYAGLAPRTQTAVIYCQNSHISETVSGKLPCICDFIKFLAEY